MASGFAIHASRAPGRERVGPRKMTLFQKPLSFALLRANPNWFALKGQQILAPGRLATPAHSEATRGKLP